jgi:Holliday junction resolvase
MEDITDMVTEYDIGAQWRGMLEKNGCVTTRLENTGASLPDLFFCVKGLVIFHEMKMQRGKCIYTSHFQWAWNVKHSNYLRAWQLNYVVWQNDQFKVFTIPQLKAAPQESASYGKIKIKIDELIPVFVVENDYECSEFVESILNQAFKNRKPK